MADLKMMLQNLRDKSKCCKKDDFTGERYTIIHDMSIETLNMICDDGIEQFENAQIVNRWIPCRERLPEYGEEVLVWYEYFRYGEYNRLYQTHGIGQFFGKYGKRESWLINHETGWQKLKVYAWMPLPDPYEEKE